MSDVRRESYGGTGPLTGARHVSVFINCPYDDDFREIFDAIVFATVSCGFFPRSAVESGSVSQPRMERISQAIGSAKYSIHDLTRCTGVGQANLARFNMPLELGMAIREGHASVDPATTHDWMALIPHGHAYRNFLSDLAGYDPVEYGGTSESVVPAVMSWLATRPDAVATPHPRVVINALPEFWATRKRLNADWCGREPWHAVVLTALECAQRCELIDGW